MQCSNNLKQMGLATLNYESTHKKFPPGRLAPDWSINGVAQTSYTAYGGVNISRTSGHWTGFRSVHSFILPFMEQTAIYNLIDFSVPTNVQMTTGGGVTPFNPNYNAYSKAAGLFICPSCPFTGLVISENNYRYNFGGSTPLVARLIQLRTTICRVHRLGAFHVKAMEPSRLAKRCRHLRLQTVCQTPHFFLSAPKALAPTWLQRCRDLRT